MGMREIEIYFALYTAATATVEYDIEDWHELEGASSEEAVDYAIGEISWFGFPSANGKFYVADEIEVGDEYEDWNLRARFAVLKGFSEEELKEIAERLDAERS